MFIFENILSRRCLGLRMYTSFVPILSYINKELFISSDCIFSKLNYASRPDTNLLKIFTVLSIINVCSASVAMGEQCDWTGSGLEVSGDQWTGETPGITPVYLRCSQGRVSWVYPRGGLRVVLRLPRGKDFRGCIKVNPTFSGARIFHKDQMLNELFAPNDALPANLARCFYSRSGEATLYIEAAAPSSSLSIFPKYLAEFSYDLETDRMTSYDLLERCRPCDEEELLRAFCTNDLVISGSIDGVQKNESMDDIEIIVNVKKVLKYSLFESVVNNVGRLSKLEENDDDEEADERSLNETFGDRTVSVTMPKICEIKPGTGWFVFMVRKKFDEYSLVCAPRWEDWKKLVRQENQNGDAHCVLNY